MRRRSPTVSNWMSSWLTFSAIVLLLGTILAVHLYGDYRGTLVREKNRLSSQARILATDVEDQVLSANHALESVLQHLPQWRTREDRQAITTYLQALVNAMPGVLSISILDAHGQVVASSVYDPPHQTLDHDDHWQDILNQQDAHRLYISPPFKSPSGRQAIALTRLISGPEGQFAGTVCALLDPSHFERLMHSALYAPDMRNMIAHSNGTIFLGVPAFPEDAGGDIADLGILFGHHLQFETPASILIGRLKPTSNKRMLAQHKVMPPGLSMNNRLIIGVSRDIEAILQPWYRELWSQTAFFCMFSALAGFGLFQYQKRRRVFDHAQKASASALRASEENYRLIVENSNDLIIKVSPDGHYTYVNPAYCALFDSSPEQLLGRHYIDDVVQEDRAMVEKHIQTLLRPPYTVRFTERDNTPGGVRHLEWTGKALRNHQGEIKELVGIGRDITEQVELLARLEQQAHLDYLTNLPNRRHFMEQGESELMRAQRYGHPLSLFMLDIDHFKHINDAHGHKAGDQVLQQLSRLLLGELREVDIIGRMGGEEFAVLLPETDREIATEVAERLRQTIEESNIETDTDAPIRYTVSIGVVALSENTYNLDMLLSMADKALYRAKESGRNRVVSNGKTIKGNNPAP